MKKKQIFTITAHPYRHDILVCAGATCDDAKKELKGTKKNHIVEIEARRELFEKVIGGDIAGYAVNGADGFIFLILPKPEDSWSYWETLMHELHHVVYNLADKKMLNNEMEAQAYLFEYLFREIRMELLGRTGLSTLHH